MDRRASLLTLAAGLTVTGAVFAVSSMAVRDEPPAPPVAAAVTTVPTTTTTTAATAAPGLTTHPTTVAAAVATAPSRPAPAGVATWAGRVERSGATMALVVADGRVVAYYCDGRRAEAWLRGTAVDGLISLSGASGAAATAVSGPAGVSGVIRVGGKARPFAVPGAPATLFRLASGGAGGGWIVRPGVPQVGVLTVRGVPRPAPALDPVTRTVLVGGRRLPVTPVLP